MLPYMRDYSIVNSSCILQMGLYKLYSTNVLQIFVSQLNWYSTYVLQIICFTIKTLLYKFSQLKFHNKFCEFEDFAACLLCKFNFEQLITNSNSSLLKYPLLLEALAQVPQPLLVVLLLWLLLVVLLLKIQHHDRMLFWLID